MSKVIKYGEGYASTNQVECSSCHSVIEYTRSDVVSEVYWSRELVKVFEVAYIDCPVCKADIKIF